MKRFWVLPALLVVAAALNATAKARFSWIFAPNMFAPGIR